MIKRKGKNQIEILILNHKPFEKKGPNEIWLENVVHFWKDLFESYKILPMHFQNKIDWERYERPKFWNNKSPRGEAQNIL
jgi:murein L,D-transpeptidase YafK